MLTKYIENDEKLSTTFNYVLGSILLTCSLLSLSLLIIRKESLNIDKYITTLAFILNFLMGTHLLLRGTANYIINKIKKNN